MDLPDRFVFSPEVVKCKHFLLEIQILLSNLALLLMLSLITKPALYYFFLTCVVLISYCVFSFTLLVSDIQELF